MLLRIRWFVIGAASSLGVMTYLAAQVKRAREKLTPRSLARFGASGIAGALESAADRIQPGD